MQIGKYTLKYQPKIDRAIQAVGDKDKAVLLAEYDRLGGLITLNGEKVKNGSFWDYKAGKAHAKPQVVVIRKPRAAEEVAVEEEAEENDEEPKAKAKKPKAKAE